MHASQVFDQLRPVCYCYGVHVMDQCEAYLYTVVCACLFQPDSQFTLSVCTIIYTWGVWDETLTPHMHKHSGNGIKLST